MPERITDIAKDLAEMAEKQRKMAFLKRASNFQASKEAETFHDAFRTAAEEALSESLDDPTLSGKQQDLIAYALAELSQAKREDPEGAEAFYREFYELPVPSVARSEIIISEDEGERLIDDVSISRNHVLAKGEPEPRQAYVIRTRRDANATRYAGCATPDADDDYFSLYTESPSPEVSAIAVRFSSFGQQYHFRVELTDQPASADYITNRAPTKDMPSNEYRIIRYCLDRFIERSGLTPPDAPTANIEK